MNTKRLIISLIAPQLAGLFGVLFTNSAIPTWYAQLAKPVFAPPNWIFGPVWTTLYIMMGVSLYLIWQKRDQNKTAKHGFVLFWIHLFFNAIWSPVFFGLKNPGLGLINILIIWGLIIALMINFWKVDRRASLLLLPYFLWVSFASVLNGAIWMLN